MAGSGRGFLGQVTTVAAGAAAAQAVTLFATPVLSRLYGPDAFGALAVYAGAVMILAGAASGRYELAIPLAGDRRDAASLVWLCLGLTGAFAVVLLLVALVVRGEVAAGLQIPEMRTWALLVPAGLLLLSAHDAGKYWATRHGRFASLSVSAAGRALSSVVVQFAIGVAAWATGGVGLLVGHLVGLAVAAMVMLGAAARRPEGLGWGEASGDRARVMAREYAALPRHMLSTSLLNQISGFGLPLVMAAILGPVEAGLVLVAQRLVIVPTQVVGQAIWQVTHARVGAMTPPQRATSLTVVNRFSALLYAFPVLVFVVFSDLSGTLLGDRWTEIAGILPAIAIMAFASSVSNATSYFAACGLYRQETVANVALTAARLLALVAAAPRFGVVGVVWSYALASTAVYLGINVFWGRFLGRQRAFFVNGMTAVAFAGAVAGAVRLVAGSSPVPAVVGLVIAGVAYYSVTWRWARASLLPSFGVPS